MSTNIDCLDLFTTDGMSSFTGNEEKGSIICAYEYRGKRWQEGTSLRPIINKINEPA